MYHECKVKEADEFSKKEFDDCLDSSDKHVTASFDKIIAKSKGKQKTEMIMYKKWVIWQSKTLMDMIQDGASAEDPKTADGGVTHAQVMAYVEHDWEALDKVMNTRPGTQK